MPVDGKAGALGDVLEFAVAEVPVEAVVAVVSDKKIGMAVVIDIADARGLRPTGTRQPGLLADFGKVALAIVAIEFRMRAAVRWR